MAINWRMKIHFGRPRYELKNGCNVSFAFRCPSFSQISLVFLCGFAFRDFVFVSVSPTVSKRVTSCAWLPRCTSGGVSGSGGIDTTSLQSAMRVICSFAFAILRALVIRQHQTRHRRLHRLNDEIASHPFKFRRHRQRCRAHAIARATLDLHADAIDHVRHDFGEAVRLAGARRRGGQFQRVDLRADEIVVEVLSN